MQSAYKTRIEDLQKIQAHDDPTLLRSLYDAILEEFTPETIDSITIDTLFDIPSFRCLDTDGICDAMAFLSEQMGLFFVGFARIGDDGELYSLNTEVVHEALKNYGLMWDEVAHEEFVIEMEKNVFFQFTGTPRLKTLLEREQLPDADTMEAKREKVASLCHEQWAGWMKHLFSLTTPGPDAGSVTIQASLVERWQRQMNASYADLRPDEQESDRREADKFLALFDTNP